MNSTKNIFSKISIANLLSLITQSNIILYRDPSITISHCDYNISSLIKSNQSSYSLVIISQGINKALRGATDKLSDNLNLQLNQI